MLEKMAASFVSRIFAISHRNSCNFVRYSANNIPPVACNRCTVMLTRNVTVLSSNRLRTELLLGSKLGGTQCSRLKNPNKFIHTSSSQLASKDFYKILGVSKNADQKEIKKAYFNLAKKYHPDKNKEDPDAAKKFAEVAEAYEILGDAAKRREYDTVGQAFGGAGGAGGFQGQWHSGSSHIDPEELFRKIFGDQAFGGSSSFEESVFGGFNRGHEVMMDLSFNEAARGVNKEINIAIEDTCQRCNGTRAEPGTKTSKCHRCNGTGQETINTGPFVMRSTCRQCGGRREIVNVPCVLCRGTGITAQRKKVTVPVPAGVEDGQTVRMPVGSNELFITFRVAKSNIFRRDGVDVHSDVTVSFTQAALGGNVKIKGIYDLISLDIPSGTQSHTRFRLAGKGISRVSGYGFGDHYVHVKIKVPTTLSANQRALLMAYAEEESGVPGTVNDMTKTKDVKEENLEASEEEKPGFFKRLTDLFSMGTQKS
ncbi:dnaJ homolog subfamily A member 3, mitochondrial-like isoform X2 [Amphiura filiformis]|uniref:dnaJ homolog subfamily A member 3, mitochondrial-like isoform X2 n=1 Tax=Amphiura filiformis TaxID=82378 RepID=UPI003B21549C